MLLTVEFVAETEIIAFHYFMNRLSLIGACNSKGFQRLLVRDSVAAWQHSQLSASHRCEHYLLLEANYYDGYHWYHVPLHL